MGSVESFLTNVGVSQTVPWTHGKQPHWQLLKTHHAFLW